MNLCLGISKDPGNYDNKLRDFSMSIIRYDTIREYNNNYGGDQGIIWTWQPNFSFGSWWIAKSAVKDLVKVKIL